MSSKLIAAVVVVGGVLATTPFYLSGYFAHKTMAEQMKLSIQPFKDFVAITNQTSQLGLYQSSYAYDIALDLSHPQFIALKEQLQTATLITHIEHKIDHGFLSIEADTRYSGQLPKRINQSLEKMKLVLTQPTQPMIDMITTADFSLTGHFQMISKIQIQGFKVEIPDPQTGDVAQLTLSPTDSEHVTTPYTSKFTANNNKISIKVSDTDISFNQLLIDGTVMQAHNKERLSLLLADHDGLFSIGSITFSDNQKTIDAATGISINSKLNTEAGRTNIGVRYAVKKIDIPQFPMSKIDDLLLDIELSFGEKALTDYAQAAQELTQSPQDPTQAMALLANLLTENIDLSLPHIKAKTVAGPIDMVANANIKAIEKATFSADPQSILSALSYAASGELPKDLLLLSGQLSTELIDNLIEQQMLELKGEQVLFKLTGDSGQLKLNDQPLM